MINYIVLFVFIWLYMIVYYCIWLYIIKYDCILLYIITYEKQDMETHLKLIPFDNKPFWVWFHVT